LIDSRRQSPAFFFCSAIQRKQPAGKNGCRGRANPLKGLPAGREESRKSTAVETERKEGKFTIYQSFCAILEKPPGASPGGLTSQGEIYATQKERGPGGRTD
jgi:hypothetical protein